MRAQAAVARRNLLWSVFAEHVGFSVWLIWSVSSAFLLAQGFDFTPQQLFLLVALPNLVGSLLRLPYTFAVPRFGGRNWTVFSAALLLVPAELAAVLLRPGVSYPTLINIAAVSCTCSCFSGQGSPRLTHSSRASTSLELSGPTGGILSRM